MLRPSSAPAHNRLVAAACAVLFLVSVWIALGPSSPAFIGKGNRFLAWLYLVLESLPMLAVVWAGAAGFGWPVRRWLMRDIPGAAVVQAATGMAVLLLLWWLIAWAGALNAATAWGLPAAGVALLIAQLYRVSKRAKDATPREAARLPWELLLAVPPTAALVVAATLPAGTIWRVEAFAYDVTSYHLQIPREWLAAGAMVPLRHNVYSFLPGLLESGFAQLAAMRGGAAEAVYLAQLFHASLALCAAAGVAAAVAQLTTPRAGAVAGAALLAVPWTLVTGSLAYNEMATLAFAAAALVVLLSVASETWRGAAVIGFLLGAATLAKPTAGPMLAVPFGLVLLTRLNHAVRWRQPPAMRKAVVAAGTAAIVGAVTLAPWFARNAGWTGNPVFPFATAKLGSGHWDAALTTRWDKGHGLAWSAEPRGEALNRQWLTNVGYGAVGGWPTPRESRNIARFDREFGVPVLWIAVALAALLTVRQMRLRRATGAMLLVLGLQLAFWCVGTHLQSRFLIPTLLPACVVLGLGYNRLRVGTEHRFAWIAPVAAACLVFTLHGVALGTMRAQTQPVFAEGKRVPAPPFAWVDTLEFLRDRPLNDLPPGSHVLMVADSSGLLYLEPKLTYHTAFDANPLGEILRRTGVDAAATTAAIRERGITHVWVHWSELRRLHETYGFDEAVTEAKVRELGVTWNVVIDMPGVATLYRMPR